MTRLLSVARKEVKHILRDPASLVIALLIPLVQLVIFGYAIDFDVRHIPTVVVDYDRTEASRSYVAGLENTQYIEVVERVGSPEEAEERLRAGLAKVAVIVPPGFGAESPSQVSVLVDGSDSTVALRAQSAFVRPGRTEIEARTRVLYNPSMRTEQFMIPGIIGIVLFLVTVSLTAFSIVREREQGTLEQLMVSPVGRLDLMLGKIMPYIALAFGEMLVVLTAGYVLFDVRVAGSLVLLLVLTVPFLVSALGLGLLISTLAKTQAQALQFTLLTMLPSILMSGFAFPRETQPGMLYLLSEAIPVTHFMAILRGVIVRGAGLAEVSGSVVALSVIAALLITVATLRFRKSLD